MKKLIATILIAIIALIPIGYAEEVPATDEAAYTLLENGSKGESVVALQERLNELGYTAGSADGIFGNKTGDAVALFQKINGLESTGVADEEMQRALYVDTAICNLEGLEGVSIVDRLAPLLAEQENVIECTQTYTYEQYSSLEDYFAAFEISNPEKVSVSNWYFSYDNASLTAYDEWKYIHVTYRTKGFAEEVLSMLKCNYKMLLDTIPDLIEEAADKEYSIVAMDYCGDDVTDDEARRDAAAICEGQMAQLQSVVDTREAFESLAGSKR